MPDDRVDTILAQWAQERPDLDSSPVAVFGRLHRLADHLRHELVAVYAAHGLTESEFDILATLRRNGAPYAMTAGDIGARTMVTSGTISKRVDRLVTAGLVRRTTNLDDARSRVVTLTSRGRRLQDKAYAAHLANESRLLEGLSAAQRHQLAALLKAWGSALGLD